MIHRDAVTGKFVTKAYADEHPDTTVSEAQNIWEIEPAEEQAE